MPSPNNIPTGSRMPDLETRVTALEQLVTKIARTQHEPVVELLSWACEERISELGRTRGMLLAIEAAARVLIAAVPDRDRLAAPLAEALQRAESDLLMLQIPEKSMPAASEGFAAVAAALRRALER
jgi:hypothetical protein